VGSSPGQTKDYKVGICCFSAKHASLRSNSKDWLARNLENVSNWRYYLVLNNNNSLCLFGCWYICSHFNLTWHAGNATWVVFSQIFIMFVSYTGYLRPIVFSDWLEFQISSQKQHVWWNSNLVGQFLTLPYSKFLFCLSIMDDCKIYHITLECTW